MKSRLVVLFLVTASALAAGQISPAETAGSVNAAAQASAPMTLEELLAAAMSSNAEIRAAERRVPIAQARQRSTGSLDDPQLMVRNWGVPLRQPWNYNQAQNMIMYSQALPGPGKRGLEREVAGAEVDISRAQAAAVTRDVAARVRKAYYDLLRNRDQQRVYGEQVRLARQAIEAARVKYVVGRAAQSDMLRAQVALSRLVERVTGLEQDGGLARAALNTLLGRDPSAPLEVTGEYHEAQALPSLAVLQEIALRNRPELAAATLAIRQGELRSKLADKSLTPDFNVSGGYMAMPPGSMSRNTYTAEVSMTLPWLNRERHQAEIAEATAMTASARADYEVQRAAALQEIQESLVKAQAAVKLVALYRNTLRPQADALLKSVAISYQNDRSDLLSLLESQNAGLEVEQAYYGSLADLDFRLADLERAVGAELPREPQAAPEVVANPTAQPKTAASQPVNEVRP